MFRSFLAPIHECTDLPFRLLCQRHGAESACVPLISAEMVARNPDKAALADAHPLERNLGIQVFGNGPEIVSRASGILAHRFPFAKYLNLNCGCPSVRTMGDGAGSAMLRKPETIALAVAGMRKASGMPVSVKMRIWNGFEGTLAIVRAAKEAGAQFVAIHGRTPEQGYGGIADWDIIRRVHDAADIHIVGNGDIGSAAQGEALVREGFCDSYMVGREAMANPLLFENGKPDGIRGRLSLLEEYARLHMELKGEPPVKALKARALGFMRGVPMACSLRNRITRAESLGDIASILETRLD